MKVITARHMGMCFGVRDAIQSTQSVPNPQDVTIHGELVHNQQVLQDLSARGFQMNPESTRSLIPATSKVLITAHGISQKERQRLVGEGKQLIDTTCPLVHRVHQAALDLQARGFFVVVIGKHNHVEVQGIVGDLANHLVVASTAEVCPYPFDRLGIVCQSTTPPSVAGEIHREIIRQNPTSEVLFVDTICHPTRARQEALRELLQQVNALVVVGGRNSNNTRQLGLLAESQHVPWCHVETAADIDATWFNGYKVVGLTAGTSTPDSVIQSVHNALTNISTSEKLGQNVVSLPARLARTSLDWLNHFVANRDQLPPVPWESTYRITAGERHAISRSIAIFQLGENAEGRHFQKTAREYAERRGDAIYPAALKLFIAEEQRHSRDLGRFMEQQRIPRLSEQWSDTVFRWLRKLWNLEICIAVLLIGELVARVYYRALRDATQSPTLQGLCKQILRDEVDHIYFQAGMLGTIRRGRHHGLAQISEILHRFLFLGTLLAVWIDHRRVFREGGYTFPRYWKRSRLGLNHALRIMRAKMKQA